MGHEFASGPTHSLVDQQILVITLLANDVFADFDFLEQFPLFKDFPSDLQVGLVELFTFPH
jgi:hypothetical protein